MRREGRGSALIAGAGAGGRDVTVASDLETASAVNSSPHDLRSDTHTRNKWSFEWMPTGGGRGHDGNRAGSRGGRDTLRLWNR